MAFNLNGLAQTAILFHEILKYLLSFNIFEASTIYQYWHVLPNLSPPCFLELKFYNVRIIRI